MGYLRCIWSIIVKDLATELHTWEMLSAMVVFSVLSLLVFSFALDLGGTAARIAAPGVFWSTTLFAGALGLSRSLTREQQTGCIDALLLAPVDRSALFFGKALGNLVLMSVVEMGLLPLASALFGAPLVSAEVIAVVLLGTLGYAAAGTLMAALAVNTRAREVMLPILLLPLAIPLLIAVVRATGSLIEGSPSSAGWISLIVTYDLVIIAVALLTFGFVVEA